MDRLKQEFENRAALYAFISRLMMQEVDEAFLDIVENQAPFCDYFPHLKKWKKKEELSRKDLVEQYYNVDYTNLFIMHLVPYETFYTRDDQMIESGFGNPVAELYDALNFSVELDKARVISVDHIGVELEFMYMLCDAQSKALEAGDKEGVCELFQIQRGFMKDHLLEWAPMFLINVKREARTPLYHDGAEMALEFMLSDYEYIVHALEKGFCADLDA